MLTRSPRSRLVPNTSACPSSSCKYEARNTRAEHRARGREGQGRGRGRSGGGACWRGGWVGYQQHRWPASALEEAALECNEMMQQNSANALGHTAASFTCSKRLLQTATGSTSRTASQPSWLPCMCCFWCWHQQPAHLQVHLLAPVHLHAQLMLLQCGEDSNQGRGLCNGRFAGAAGACPKGVLRHPSGRQRCLLLLPPCLAHRLELYLLRPAAR